MTIVLSHETAVQCWRSGWFDTLLGGTSIWPSHRPSGTTQVERTSSLIASDRLSVTYVEALAFGDLWEHDPLSFKPNARDIKELRKGLPLPADEAVHVLVPDARSVNNIQGVACHRRSTALPAGSLIRVNAGLMLCAPELAFLQLADKMSLVRAVRLGYELCAQYSFQPDGSVSYGRPLPPTTVRSLGAYLDRCAGEPGIVQARKALAFVADNSGSPMETALAMALSLPPRLGGYGLPLPKMNYRVEVRRGGTDGGAGGKRSPRYYLCDLYWPGKRVDLEYDSDQEHVGPDRISADAERRNDLQALKIMPLTATREQAMNDDGLDRLARQVGGALGVRVRAERVQGRERGAGLQRML